jgi:hypothetical protein
MGSVNIDWDFNKSREYSTKGSQGNELIAQRLGDADMPLTWMLIPFAQNFCRRLSNAINRWNL